MTTVVPAIIPNNREQLEEEIKKVSGFANLIQIDISDGIFTPTKTWPYNGKDVDFFDKLKKEEDGLPGWLDTNYEVHLMVKNPEEVAREWIFAGASTIIAHIEATENFQKIIDICKENMVSVGIAIKPTTDIARLDKFVSEIDFIQVMGNDLLGKHGVSLDEKAVEMIKKLHAHYPECIIGIDIGVSIETKQTLLDAGATKLIAGSAILSAHDPEDVYEELSK